jgi:hypothetical protein
LQAAHCHPVEVAHVHALLPAGLRACHFEGAISKGPERTPAPLRRFGHFHP